MNCSEIQELLSAYFDNELSLELHEKVKVHVDNCDACTTELISFSELSELGSSVAAHDAPTKQIWSSIEKEIEAESSTAAIPSNFDSRTIIRFVLGLAAVVLLGVIGFQLLPHDDHDHQEMAQAIKFVAENLDSDNVTTHLLKKYGGGNVSLDQAVTQVGFRPIVHKGLPEGYSVESIQVLKMPCCKCTQTACRRPDNSRYFIYEHENEETGWFDHQRKTVCQCGGKKCQVVDLGQQKLAATYSKEDRHITFLGIRDQNEIELLMKQFDD